MECHNRIDSVLLHRGEEIIKYINALMSAELRKHVVAEEVLGETVRYLLEHPQWVERRNDEKLFRLMLWKSKMILIDRSREWKLHVRATTDLLAAGETPVATRHTELSPSIQLHRKDKRAALLRCLNLIDSENQRLALQLVRIDGFSLQEAAEIMGRKPQAVRDLVRNGFENLIKNVRKAGGWKYATSGETT